MRGCNSVRLMHFNVTDNIYLSYIQYVCNDRYFFWTDQKNQPYLQFFWIDILSHHKIPVPIGLDAKVFLIQHWI